MSKRYSKFWRIASATFLTASACALSPVATQAQTVTAVMQAGLRSLDPIITTAYIVRDYGFMVYDTLLAVDAENRIKPQMLEKWEVSPDGKVYTFTLRNGLKWHDGNLVTAEDCVASIKRWAALDKTGQVMNSLLDSMQVINDKSFSMRFKEPTDIALRALSKSSALPALMMPKRVAQTPTSEPIKETIGSGPFRFIASEYKPGVQVVFEKNLNYVPRNEPASGMAGGKVVKVDRVKWVTMPDMMTTTNALINKEIDFIEMASYDLLPLIENNPDINLIDSRQQGGQSEMRFNFLYPPFNNKLIRQAAMLAIDQHDVMQAQIGNPKYYQTCAAVFGCGGPYASALGAENLVKGNIEKAAQLLKKANYDGTPVVILHPTDIQIIAPIPPVIAQALRKAGFIVDLQAMDWQSVISRRASREAPSKGGWNIFATSTGLPDIRDPLGFMGVAANGKDAWFGWPDIPAIEERRALFARTNDPAKLKKLADEIQKLVLDEGVIVPLGQYIVVSAASKSLSDIVQGPVPVFWNLKKTGK